jgi:hypothetical protein
VFVPRARTGCSLRTLFRPISGDVTFVSNDNELLHEFTESHPRTADHSDRAVKGMSCLRPLKHKVVGSNFTQGMDVCARLFCVCVILCVGSGLATG